MHAWTHSHISNVWCYTSGHLGRNQSGKLGQGGEEREMREVSEEEAFVLHRRWIQRDASTQCLWPLPKVQETHQVPSKCLSAYDG